MRLIPSQFAQYYKYYGGMIFLALRLLLAPAAVLAGTAAQRRFGHAISGLIVGLPLASLPLLWLVAVQHGDAFAGTMTAALLVGGIAEAAVLWLYAHLTARLSPAVALVGALVAFAVVAIIVNLLGLSPITAGVLTAVGFAVALWWWPNSAREETASPDRSRLSVRVLLAALFTFVLVTLAGRLGPVWSGLLDALPAMSMMMAFMTHLDNGAGASSGFLRGVTRGSFSYVAAMLVLAELLHTGNLLLAFGAALGVALVVQGLIQAVDVVTAFRRSSEVNEPVEGTSHSSSHHAEPDVAQCANRRYGRAARIATPSPFKSARYSCRPVMAMTSDNMGPDTSGPLP